MEEANGGGGGRRLAVNCLSWVGLVGSLNVWRGVWSVADFHFLPELDLSTNLLVSHIVGFLGLLFCRSTLTLTFTVTKGSPNPSESVYYCNYWERFPACVSRQENEMEEEK